MSRHNPITKEKLEAAIAKGLDGFALARYLHIRADSLHALYKRVGVTWTPKRPNGGRKFKHAHELSLETVDRVLAEAVARECAPPWERR